MTFREDYIRGLDALHDYAPYFYRIMRFIGVPSENYNIDTAQVSYDPHSKSVLFEINPDLIENMEDENIGFVIAHEAYHVLLRHLSEIVDTVEFPNRDTLINAQEAIINDTVKNILGLDEPDIGIIFGEKFGADFSGFSTREAYDWIDNSSDEDNSSDDKGDSDSADNGDPSENSDGDSEQDSSGNSDSNSDSSGSGDSDSAEDVDDSADSSSSAASAGEGDSDSENSEDSHACGGVKIPEGYEDEFMKVVSDSLKDYIKDSADKNEDVGDELLNAIENFGEEVGEDITGGYGISNNTGTMFIGDTGDNMNLDWKYLISEFNPKIMAAGGQKNKTRDNWTSPNRRMMSVYPRVILPKRERINNSDENGSDVPTFILALDMSGSIPTRLIAGLANLADTIPSGFVNVMPVTWSDTVQEFDTVDRQIVRRGGTNINNVWAYSQEVKKKIGKEPYVFVITDGQCKFNDYWSRSNWNSKNDKVVQDNWYWGAIDKSSVSAIKRYMNDQVDTNKVYEVDKFLI